MGDASSSLMDGRKEKGIERRWDIVGYKTAARRQSDGGRLPKAFVGRRQRGGTNTRRVRVEWRRCFVGRRVAAGAGGIIGKAPHP